MKIKFEYMLKTNSDFILKDADKFGCTGTDVTIDNCFYDYVGAKEFVYDDVARCKREVESFLAKFLCEGLCVLFSEYSLVGTLFTKIDNLIQYINEKASGEIIEVLTGDYKGTSLKITICEDVTPASERNKSERIQQLKAMYKFMVNSNDEELYMRWIVGGIPDCPSEDDFEYVADDEELYTGCCNLFTELVQKKGWRY